MSIEEGCAGHWLAGSDGADASGRGYHGTVHGVRFDAGATGQRGGLFDGCASWIEVPDAPGLRFGTGDFSLSAWVHTDQTMSDVPGDIVSKYDPASRKGFHLSLLSLAGVTSAQPNCRNLHFGIDAGDTPRLTDRGRPGLSTFAACLAVHDGSLYVGTFEAGANGVGHVYRYSSGTEWIDCGSPAACNSVTSLAVFNGELYAGASHYRASGSSLTESPNLLPGGRICRYGGGTTWIDCGKPGGPSMENVVDADYMKAFVGWAPGEADAVQGLAVYNGALYMIPMYHQGLFRYEGGTEWTDCGTPGRRLMSLAVFNGYLYGAGNEGMKRGGVYRYDGRCWSGTGDQPGVDQTYSFAIHDGKLYVGTWPEAAVFRYDGGETWVRSGRLGGELEVMGMAVYNGKLYGGTLPLAEVYRYEGSDRWAPLGRMDLTPDVRYRRVWSMAIFDGMLFCGTLPSGRVWSLEAGANVTCDRELASGWRHIAAVRRRDRLELFVDGRITATSTRPLRSAFDTSNGQPLRIGAGANDRFCGRIRDLRLHARALTDTEVSALSAT